MDNKVGKYTILSGMGGKIISTLQLLKRKHFSLSILSGSVADPKWQSIRDFSNLKIETPYTTFKHFMAFISVHNYN